MADYIKRQAVLDAIPHAEKDDKISLFGAVADFIMLVSEIPAADVAPVVHGQWVNGCQCSVCGDRHGPYNSRHKPFYNYCPNCGAKMDEVKDDV